MDPTTELKETGRKDMSRRQFLTIVGKMGGAAAMYSMMGTLGLLSPETVKAAEFEPPSKNDLSAHGKNGKRIIILGAGVAGMTAAYELTKAGYDCVLLEARDRAGGRCWTVRRGTTETEVGGVKQVARFDEGLYMNPGPARIPQFHSTLQYCKELGVQVEVFTNTNDSAYYYNENVGPLSGKKIQKRQAKADVRGYTAEILAKALDQRALDLSITSEDKQKLVEYLRAEGNLSPDLFYKGSERAGYVEEPGGGLDAGVLRDPFDMKSIIQSGFGNYFSGEYTYDQQMIMFHPVGGMDMIAKAFEKRVGHMIKYQAEVQEIRQTGSGVRIVYKQKGEAQEITGDYCICTIPLPVLAKIPADFSSDMATAISKINYANAGKIGLQFKRRFWEEDELIFGGFSTTNMDITQIWYPATHYFSKKGVLIGYYNFGGNADSLGKMSLAQREAHALSQGSKIHSQYYEEFETSFSVNWKTIKYNLGGWVSYTADDRKTYYPTLCKPDGRIYLAGEHISYINAWQAGAIDSARKAVTAIHERVLKA